MKKLIGVVDLCTGLVADEATASECPTSLRRYRLSVVSGLD
jgi:hypothetical protein